MIPWTDFLSWFLLRSNSFKIPSLINYHFIVESECNSSRNYQYLCHWCWIFLPSSMTSYILPPTTAMDNTLIIQLYNSSILNQRHWKNFWDHIFMRLFKLYYDLQNDTLCSLSGIPKEDAIWPWHSRCH